MSLSDALEQFKTFDKQYQLSIAERHQVRLASQHPNYRTPILNMIERGEDINQICRTILRELIRLDAIFKFELMADIDLVSQSVSLSIIPSSSSNLDTAKQQSNKKRRKHKKARKLSVEPTDDLAASSQLQVVNQPNMIPCKDETKAPISVSFVSPALLEQVRNAMTFQCTLPWVAGYRPSYKVQQFCDSYPPPGNPTVHTLANEQYPVYMKETIIEPPAEFADVVSPPILFQDYSKECVEIANNITMDNYKQYICPPPPGFEPKIISRPDIVPSVCVPVEVIPPGVLSFLEHLPIGRRFCNYLHNRIYNSKIHRSLLNKLHSMFRQPYRVLKLMLRSIYRLWDNI